MKKLLTIMMLLVTIVAGAETSTKTIYVYAKGWGNLTGCKVAAYGWSPTQIFTDMQKDDVYTPCYKIEVEEERSVLIFCKLNANATNDWDNVSAQTVNVNVELDAGQENDLLVVIKDDYQVNSYSQMPIYDVEVSTIDKLADYAGGETDEPQEYLFNFDGDDLQGWTTIDADGDGYDWVLAKNSPGVYHNTSATLSGTGHGSSEGFVVSGSYSNATGNALTPNNFLVSPKIKLGGHISFYASAQDASYAAEHFGVCVSTTGNTSASDFTTVQEWTMTAAPAYGKKMAPALGKSSAKAPMKTQGNWYLYTVELSAYADQEGYVAIRHFNCTDQFVLNVDDITLSTKTILDVGDVGSGNENPTLYNVWVAGTQVTSKNTSDVFDDGTVSYDAETQTLTLNNATITTDEDVPLIGFVGDLTIELAEGTTNTVGIAGENGVSNGIAQIDDGETSLTIQGAGVLNLNARKDVLSINGDVLIQKNATVNMTLDEKFKVNQEPWGGTSWTTDYEGIFSSSFTLDNASVKIDVVLRDVTKDYVSTSGYMGRNLTLQNNSTLEIITSGGSSNNRAIYLYPNNNSDRAPNFQEQQGLAKMQSSGNGPTLIGENITILEGDNANSAEEVEELTNVSEYEGYFMSKPYVKIVTTQESTEIPAYEAGTELGFEYGYDVSVSTTYPATGSGTFGIYNLQSPGGEGPYFLKVLGKYDPNVTYEELENTVGQIAERAAAGYGVKATDMLVCELYSKETKICQGVLAAQGIYNGRAYAYFLGTTYYANGAAHILINGSLSGSCNLPNPTSDAKTGFEVCASHSTSSTKLLMVKDVTCTESGIGKECCTICGVSKSTQTLEPLGHDLTSVVTDPTCEEAGFTTFTCSRCGDSYVGNETPALGHNWGEATYEWADDNSAVTASHSCQRDPSHVDSETVETTSKITKEPTTTEEGEMTYTAEFTKSGFTTQTKVVPIPPVDEEDGIEINEENFPDPNFREFVKQNLDTNGSGFLSDEEIAAVTSLNVNNQGIADLKGIEFFADLEYLSCSDNVLTELDVRKLTKLQTLNCSSNYLLTLDVTKNEALMVLECGDNGLLSLDLSMNKELARLDCSENALTSLDLSQNEQLHVLSCYSNKLDEFAMSALVASLPTVADGKLFAINTNDDNEGNVMTKPQVATARGKGWKVMDAANSDLYEGTDPTGIGTIENDLTGDGQPVYNLQGQRVNTARHGIFIKNGKKVVVK